MTGFLDTQAIPQPTVRHNRCTMLLSEEDPSRCQQCSVYRRTLHVLVHRRSQEQPQHLSTPSSHANYRYLSTPQKVDRLRQLHHGSRCLQKQLRRREDSIAALIAKEGVTLDVETSQDIGTIMTEENANIASKYPAQLPKNVLGTTDEGYQWRQSKYELAPSHD